LKSVLTKISAIKRNPNNPRILKDDKFAKLTQSIKDFPQMLDIRPIVVNDDMIVLGGNMRLKACKEAGLKEVPVIKVKDLTEEQQREFIIKDNVGFGEWDWDLLANEWDTDLLEDWGLELDFNPEDDDNAGLTDEDDVPEVTEVPVSKVGDIWLLGEHRVMCGDSTNGGDVALLMNGEKADMVFTDPPYGVDFQSNYRTKSEKFEVLKNDNVFLDGWIPLVKEYSNGFVFVWTSWKVVKDWIDICKPIGDLSNMIVWSKGGGGIGDLKKTFSTDYEIALVYHRETQLTGKRLGSIWSINKDGAATYKHPTQKPVELTEMALDSCSVKNNLIMDLFLGSGSTLIAAEKKNRKCYGMELDPKYIDVIIKRWQDYTGKKAIHAESGEPFVEVSND
jgi:DNA modification methylase